MQQLLLSLVYIGDPVSPSQATTIAYGTRRFKAKLINSDPYSTQSNFHVDSYNIILVHFIIFIFRFLIFSNLSVPKVNLFFFCTPLC